MESNKEGRDSSASTSRSHVVLDYIKVLIWPVLIVGILVAYRPPIGEMLESFAEKIQAASKLEFGSFAMEVREQASALGGHELADEIGELSGEAIRKLMQIAPGYAVPDHVLPDLQRAHAARTRVGR